MDASSTTEPPRSYSLHALPSITVDDPKEPHYHHPADDDDPEQDQPARRRPRPPTSRRAYSHDVVDLPSIRSGPMPIPNARDDVPPPLPPPRHIEDLDIAWQFDQRWHRTQKSLPSISPGSSLLGGMAAPPRLVEAGHAPSGSPFDTVQDAVMRDEGYVSLSGSSLDSRTLKASQISVDKAYDRGLLDKLNAARSDPARGSMNAALRGLPLPSFRESGVELSPRSKLPSGPPQESRVLQPLSMPDHGASMEDGRAARRETGSSSDSAVSITSKSHAFGAPSFLGARHPPRHNSSLSSVPESELAHLDYERATSRSGSGSMRGSNSYDESMVSGSRSQRSSRDQIIFTEPESDIHLEESQMKRLRLADSDRTSPRPHRYSPSSKAGQKRRASSPPREREDRSSLGTSGNPNELFHRRSSGHLSTQRLSPTRRFPHGSLSSASSTTRAGSIVSSAGISLATNSLTGASSRGDRISPGGISPTSELDSRHASPFARSLSLNPSQRSSLPKTHQRATSESKAGGSARKLSNGVEGVAGKIRSAPKLQGVYICECCPKKPKRFDTADELRIHETEKQYTCHYCHNRFKNKNEAERHQNSLHLRRHSWSCAALSSYEAAFHPSSSSGGSSHNNTNHNNSQNDKATGSSGGGSSTDVCGYCGAEFPNPANWSVRIEHLQNMHKFGECNQAKKFFRADHFRQHLKHSHAGTSGKWTNMLENACMKDEPAPTPLERGSSGDVDGVGVRVNVIDEEADEE